MKETGRTLEERFVFRANDLIGHGAAEIDQDYLSDCYVENDYQSAAENIADKRVLITGRTGTGKTALLQNINSISPKNSVLINPEDLCFNYIANNKVIDSIESSRGRLDQFYKILWKQVFVVELLRKRFGTTDPAETKRNILANFLNAYGKKAQQRQKALKYLEKYGDTFFVDSQETVKTITKEFTDGVKTSMRIGLSDKLDASLGGDINFTEAEKAELVNTSSDVVNRLQVIELNTIIDWLSNDVFSDQSDPFYILIDGLDRDWIDQSLRYKLIHSLIESAIGFRVKSVKPLVAMRTDLLERVLLFRGTGETQIEKIRDCQLEIRWSRLNLEKMLDERIAKLVRNRYTSKRVAVRDVLGQNTKSFDPISYIFDRTFDRPRDAISFLNGCIAKSPNSPAIRNAAIDAAEDDYSESRFMAVIDEWKLRYPELRTVAETLLEGMKSKFTLKNFSRKRIDDTALTVLDKSGQHRSEIYGVTEQYLEGSQSGPEQKSYLCSILQILYKVGVVGVKRSNSRTFRYSYTENQSTISTSVIANSELSVHSAFWRKFGIKATKSASIPVPSS